MILAVPEGHDRVPVVTSNGTLVEISIASRDAIVAWMQHRERMESAICAFETASGSGAVDLDWRDGAAVLDAIRALEERVGGAGHLEPGVAELQRTLDREWRARRADEDARRE
jgi:hypothetical protein